MGEKGLQIHLGGTARSPEDVRAIHGLGLQFAELPLRDGVFPEIETYVDLRDRLGIYYLCHGPREGDPNDPRGLEKKYLPKVLSLFPLMKRLQASLLNIHLWLDHRYVKEDVLSFKVGLLREILVHAREAGVLLCLENLSEGAPDFETALEALPELCLTLDLGHAQLLTDTNRADALLERYPDRIRHIHLHDNRGGSTVDADLQRPVGEGIIDFNGSLRRLGRIGYDRTITLELRPDEIAQSLSRVKKLLALAAS